MSADRYEVEDERQERGSFTGRIVQDPDPQSPKEWDQLGTVVTWHRRFCLDEDGEKAFGSPQDFLRAAKRGRWIYLPISLLDHSGQTIWVGSGPSSSDPGGWDSGQVGFIYATRESIEKIGTPIRQVRSCLRSEVETWDQWLKGDVYGYEVTGPDGDVVDSCWGFYGVESAREEMLASLESSARQEQGAEQLEREHFAL